MGITFSTFVLQLLECSHLAGCHNSGNGISSKQSCNKVGKQEAKIKILNMYSKHYSKQQQGSS
jgi:hypothetical protein